MVVFLGADHRGYKLKERLKKWLRGEEFLVEDLGAEMAMPGDDYVVFARAVAKKVIGWRKGTREECRGIVMCGSGVGVSIAANRLGRVRCGLGLNKEQVAVARRDDDINVLALAADFVSWEEAREMVRVFLETRFSGEGRHKRRIRKLEFLT